MECERKIDAAVQPDYGRQETALARHMRENYGYYGGLSLIYGCLFAFCMYENPNGITCPVFVVLMLVIAYRLLKKSGIRVKKDSFVYAAGMLLLGIGTAMTVSWFLIFFNLLGILLLFLAAMIHQFYEDGSWSFASYLKMILSVCFATLARIFTPLAHGYRFLTGAKEGRRKHVIAVGSGVLMAAILLVFVLPMLLKSDMIFAGIFKNVFRSIHFGSFFGIAFMVFCGFVSSYGFFYALCDGGKEIEEGNRRKNFDSLIGITFTATLAVVYVAYAVIQVMYLFMRIDGGLPAGVTYSEYARQGFFELLFVGIINFILVLACMCLFAENRVLYGLLTVISGCTFIMIASAAYRMLLYVQVYHLTFLRLLVLWFLAVLALIMGGAVISIYKRKFPLFRYIVAVVGCGYILFSLAKPDRLIAEYNLSHMETVNEQDFYYMVYGLSEDAAPALAKLDPDTVEIQDYYYLDDLNTNAQIREMLGDYFNGISNEYDTLSLRQLNLSKVQARNAAEEWKAADYAD